MQRKRTSVASIPALQNTRAFFRDKMAANISNTSDDVTAIPGFCSPVGWGPTQPGGLLTPCFVNVLLYNVVYVPVFIYCIHRSIKVFLRKSYSQPPYLRHFWKIVFAAIVLLSAVIEFVLNLVYRVQNQTHLAHVLVHGIVEILTWSMYIVTILAEATRFHDNNKFLLYFQKVIFIPATIEIYGINQGMFGSLTVGEVVIFKIKYTFIFMTTLWSFLRYYVEFGYRHLRPIDFVYEPVPADECNGHTVDGRLMLPGYKLLNNDVESGRPHERGYYENWKGVKFGAKCMLAPANKEEVIRIVKKAAAEGQKVRIIGSGHSDDSILTTSGYLVSLHKMDKIISVEKVPNGFSPEGDQYYDVTVQAGKYLKEFFEELASHPADPKGVCLPVAGDINEQSVAGIIATGSHGSGGRFPSISNYVIGMEIVKADGEILKVTKEDPKMLDAVRVHLGVFGVVTEVTLRCVKNYHIKKVRRGRVMGEVFDELETKLKNNEHFEFFYFPHTNMCQTVSSHRCFCKENDDPNDDCVEPNKFSTFMTWYVENFILLTVHRIANYFTSLTPLTMKFQTLFLDATPISGDTTLVQSGNVRLERFSEIEIAIPYESGKKAFEEIQELIQEAKEWEEPYMCNQIIEVRFSRGETSYLSPLYLPKLPERPKGEEWRPDFMWISLNAYDEGTAYRRFFLLTQNILIDKYGGRPHWGKQTYMSARQRGRCFPKFTDFVEERLKHDPTGMFVNSYLADAFLPEGNVCGTTCVCKGPCHCAILSGLHSPPIRECPVDVFSFETAKESDV
ncbi:Hypp5533 [Branchiostoma lanceolatum]|uniref:Hypp5533 protein n=1 Tax=Branchiostoma lanceolatum TaxID=7740 RepID=A0A8J9VDH4_BRALA|nr:Hypp5533 [Branchiostoma lanceolatum]